MKELAGCSKGEKVIIARIGKKLRTEMVKKAADSGIKILNERGNVRENKISGKASGMEIPDSAQKSRISDVQRKPDVVLK